MSASLHGIIVPKYSTKLNQRGIYEGGGRERNNAKLLLSLTVGQRLARSAGEDVRYHTVRYTRT